MIEYIYNDKNNCTGCKLCEYICPLNAIDFSQDELGFEYPQINVDKCINCKKCVKNCPQFETIKFSPLKSYAAVANDERLLITSASGGIFSTIARQIINNGGVVYGASMQTDNDNILVVRHERIEKEDELITIQRSKYLQSDMTGVYAKIETDIKRKRKIIFSGTPCQAAAVRQLFGSYDNLLIIDIICHGVPSQKMFSDYLKEYQSHLMNQKIIDFNFRSKETGWGLCAEALVRDKIGKIKKIQIPSQISSYYSMFLHCENYRESCYHCQYATKERVGDLTLGDYWGIQNIKQMIEECDSKGIEITNGVSCILVNTKKGNQLLKSCNLKTIETNFESIARENHQLSNPSKCPNTHEEIISIYKNYGYHALEIRFNKKLGLKKYIIKLRKYLPAKFRMQIRKLFGK